MQIKTTVRYHLTPDRSAITNKQRLVSTGEENLRALLVGFKLVQRVRTLRMLTLSDVSQRENYCVVSHAESKKKKFLVQVSSPGLL